VAILKGGKFGSLTKISNALPAVTAPPLWGKLKDSVNGITLFGRPLFDSRDQ
jgi:hypothetical protein